MGVRTLVTFPEERSVDVVAEDIAIALGDRWVDARATPLPHVEDLAEYDSVVLGGAAPWSAELERFVAEHCELLREIPVAVFLIGFDSLAARAAIVPRLSALRAQLAPVSVGHFGAPPHVSEASVRRAARRWSAQLSWTLSCACGPDLADVEPWPPAASEPKMSRPGAAHRAFAARRR